MMGWVANTDYSWFTFLRNRRADEVNFWQPSGGRGFHAVKPGAPFFLKLKRPHDAIGGFGFFAHHSVLPAWLAWDTFREGNGAPDLDTMCRNIERLRRTPGGGRPGSYDIGCLVLTGCVFFADEDWVRMPYDYAKNIVQGKTYDLRSGEGERIWRECSERASAVASRGGLTADMAVDAAAGRYGKITLIQPRLGQGAFRVAVLDAYGRACAVSTEHSLPVLEAAHIRGYAEGGAHDVRNGICLRSDIHRLFDAGYVTVDEERRFVVSRRLKDDYDNGKVYYAFQGRTIELPRDPGQWPDPTSLQWHRERRFVA
ncbi:MAG TPA: HNH endonuclease [Candidatus Krumholzibacteria bacterium]|nr:HNH endonuclease [Candidatus Krumholzibacteria bacterium]HPD72964.1 HNH endonuclease [Candidatus Krumholzibacteria bacterium]HRY41763.1 HNH endonuclease [Candidatus Krumholzibacteria bacterium]